MFSTKLLNKCYFGITNYIVIYVLLGRVFERLKKWDIDFNIYFNNYIDLMVGKQTWRRVSISEWNFKGNSMFEKSECQEINFIF